MTYRLNVFYPFLWSSFTTILTHACGMGTHIQVSQLATTYMEHEDVNGLEYKYFSLLKRNPRALQAGSFFPDWGYACREYETVGEEAHWPPFYEAAVDYIVQKYPTELENFIKSNSSSLKALESEKDVLETQPNDKKFETLLAFMLGTVSHGTADVAWHGQDGRELGFIQALGIADWKGDHNFAHKVADPGGDLTLAHATRLTYFKAIWDLPVDDILNIYRSMGFTKVRWWDFRRCMALGLTGAQFTRYSGASFLGRFNTDKSPFLINQFEHHFHGGLFNMASLVRHCWGEFITKLESLGNTERGVFCKLQFPNFDRHAFLMKDKEENPLISERMADFYSDSDFVGETENQPTIQQKCMVLSDDDVDSIEGSHNYGQLGHGVTVGNYEGGDRRYLAVSAPYAHDLRKPSVGNETTLGVVKLLTTDLQPIQSLISPPSWVNESKFGMSLVSLDLNCDGFDDLLVGAPSYTIDEDTLYQGRVWVYLGSSRGLSSTPDTYFVPKKLKEEDNISYYGLGEVMHVADLNMDGQLDLLVGSPNAADQSGVVCSYLARLEGLIPQTGIEFDWCVTASNQQPDQHFGRAIEVVVDDSNHQKWVFVGAPGTDLGLGQIYGIPIDPDGWPAGPSYPIIDTDGLASLGGGKLRLGSSLTIIPVSHNNDSVKLITGAPSQSTKAHWQAGQTYLIDLSSLRDLPSTEPDLISPAPILGGTDSPGSLGAQTLLMAPNKLLINEPLANWESGRLHFWGVDESTSHCIELPNRSSNQKSRFGSHMNLLSLSGDNSVDLLISQSHYSNINGKDESNGLMVGRLLVVRDVLNRKEFASKASRRNPIDKKMAMVGFDYLVYYPIGIVLILLGYTFIRSIITYIKLH